ncbi:hypothetical protein H9Y04_15025 [Streptomyces sp. TRM66268-LWL]|uniref:Uncharacterized protein n=1 Tax=Streptomyces polyasparticus TaxID=2767826 RepID=A0ABR7SEE3_9ACTN|nr:hypothetical protein [Streptomyces polyasparticus]MBC9713881.1 hypothetical protein [Streptomyces polyasparticus]
MNTHSESRRPHAGTGPFAGRHGSTRDVAKRIAAGLVERGLKAEAAPVKPCPEIGAYDAFVNGSALRQGA